MANPARYVDDFLAMGEFDEPALAARQALPFLARMTHPLHRTTVALGPK